jgi:Cytochrome P450
MTLHDLNCPFQTSHTMQWVLYSLGRNPAVQDRVADECRRSIELAPTAGDRWQQMSLMKGSVKEALRLYPVAPFLTRILPDESQIGDYQVPAGVSCRSVPKSLRILANVFLPRLWCCCRPIPVGGTRGISSNRNVSGPSGGRVKRRRKASPIRTLRYLSATENGRVLDAV